ncbi:response regulator transcription factor [Parachitinimonas caeni]|uniref:Response regulator transcription factor n=1 Tax=Parachitinimonas caeni TaxID=3031301 RepID=A0ABT7DY16_9NEIS|nr:response regulator transcription factor [Parachitinimonas caeni]MDK2123537.1 response regulator transcription factor [Parachitinimonas caeni]
MFDQSKPTVIVIDDDTILRTLIASILRDADINVIADASNGEAGLKLCQEKFPDLVLLDINLPGAGGLEILGQLLKLPKPPKVVMISGEATADRVRTALTSGARGFVVKPFNAAKLLAAVQAALKK